MIKILLIIFFSFLSSCTSVELAANLGKKVFLKNKEGDTAVTLAKKNNLTHFLSCINFKFKGKASYNNFWFNSFLDDYDPFRKINQFNLHLRGTFNVFEIFNGLYFC